MTGLMTSCFFASWVAAQWTATQRSVARYGSYASPKGSKKKSSYWPIQGNKAVYIYIHNSNITHSYTKNCTENIGHHLMYSKNWQTVYLFIHHIFYLTIIISSKMPKVFLFFSRKHLSNIQKRLCNQNKNTRNKIPTMSCIRCCK